MFIYIGLGIWTLLIYRFSNKCRTIWFHIKNNIKKLVINKLCTKKNFSKLFFLYKMVLSLELWNLYLFTDFISLKMIVNILILIVIIFLYNEKVYKDNFLYFFLYFINFCSILIGKSTPTYYIKINLIHNSQKFKNHIWNHIWWII